MPDNPLSRTSNACLTFLPLNDGYSLNHGSPCVDRHACGPAIVIVLYHPFRITTMSSSSIPTPFHFPSAMRSSGTNRRFVLLFLVVACLLTIFFLGSLRHSGGSASSTLPISNSPGARTKGHVNLTGHVVAPKLGNETAKYDPLKLLDDIDINVIPGLS